VPGPSAGEDAIRSGPFPRGETNAPVASGFAAGSWRKLPARSRAPSRAWTRSHRAASAPQAPSREARRSLRSSRCKAAMKISRSLMELALLGPALYRTTREPRWGCATKTAGWPAVWAFRGVGSGPALELLEEPGPREGPAEVGGPGRDAQRLGRLLVAQPGEVAELHQLGRLGVLAGEEGQGLVQGDE